MKIAPERLALWFLRLNGFLTMPNFIVHPEAPREDGAYPQQTDVDVLGVRFPFRAENRNNPMPDFPLFKGETRVQVVLSEVKTDQCKLNGPWTNPKLQNLQKVLCAGGFRPPDQAPAIASALYETGCWRDEGLLVRLLCFGAKHNRNLAQSHPDVPQLLWHVEVLPFIFKRFNDYHFEKRMHEQWGEDGKRLFLEGRNANGSQDAFLQAVQVIAP